MHLDLVNKCSDPNCSSNTSETGSGYCKVEADSILLLFLLIKLFSGFKNDQGIIFIVRWLIFIWRLALARPWFIIIIWCFGIFAKSPCKTIANAKKFTTTRVACSTILTWIAIARICLWKINFNKGKVKFMISSLKIFTYELGIKVQKSLEYRHNQNYSVHQCKYHHFHTNWFDNYPHLNLSFI